MSSATTKTQSFRDLHIPGQPFILANAWDIGSARILAGLGAKAIATSSSAYAVTLGITDGRVTRDQALEHAKDLNEAVDLPVSGDFENGFGADVESVIATINAALDAELAGCCLEDTVIPANESYDFDHSLERIEAAVHTIRQHENDLVLAARADGVLRGNYDADEAIRRLRAYEAAGADVLYAPMLPTMEDLARLCSAVSLPVNALCAGKYTQYTIADFANIGVARISLGGSLARVAHKAVLDAATPMFTEGDLSKLSKGVGGNAVDALLG